MRLKKAESMGGWVNVCVLQGKYKMSPEELVVPESREVLEE